MPAYRVYVVTADGHIVGPAQVIECENEQDAIGQAAQPLRQDSVGRDFR